VVKTETLFKKASKEEEQIVLSFLLKEFDTKVREIMNNKSIFIKQRGVKEVYIVNEELKDTIEFIRNNSLELTKNIFLAGYPIGTIHEKQFQLEITGGFYFNKYMEKRLIIKTKQFLYGKDIVLANVKKYTLPFKKGNWLAVYGRGKKDSGLFYGVGKALVDSNELSSAPPNTVIIKGCKHRPFDLGWYLRFEK